MDNGHGQAQWVAEKLVWQAVDRGLPVCLYRPGNIGHHRTTGTAPERWRSQLRYPALRDGDHVFVVLADTLPDVEVYLQDTSRYDCSTFHDALSAAGLPRPRTDPAYLSMLLPGEAEAGTRGPESVDDADRTLPLDLIPAEAMAE